MLSNRKVRFTVIMLAIAACNIGIWISSRFYDLTIKQMGGYFLFVSIFDVVAVLGFAALGVLTTYLLAFKPDALRKSIERSMAKNSN
jgi:hypothetical protein